MFDRHIKNLCIYKAHMNFVCLAIQHFGCGGVFEVNNFSFLGLCVYECGEITLIRWGPQKTKTLLCTHVHTQLRSSEKSGHLWKMYLCIFLRLWYKCKQSSIAWFNITSSIFSSNFMPLNSLTILKLTTLTKARVSTWSPSSATCTVTWLWTWLLI